MSADRCSDPEQSLERELAAFESGALDPGAFDHAAHVRMAFAMTGRHAFDEALVRYGAALRRLCASVGKPEKYHMTVTVAFLALVAERQIDHPDESWEAFAARNAELLRRDCLDGWYDRSVIASERARRTFVLPEPWVRRDEVAAPLPPDR